MIGIAGIIVTMMAINLLWSLAQYRRQAEAEMKEKAAVIAQQLIATRTFIANKQDVINWDSSGRYEFKHLNPAAVGKGIGDIFNQHSGYQFKQTRLQVRDPENAPDNFEIEMLKHLAGNPATTEVWGNDVVNGTKVFRYLVPLYYDESCMPCHGKPAGETDVAGYNKEGHSPGDFAGALSIVFPMTAFEANIQANVMTQVSFILIIVLTTIGAIYIMMEHIIITPIKELTTKVVELGNGQLSAQINEIYTYDEIKSLAKEFNSMADRLQQLYNELEDKVAERTKLLSEANLQLIEQGKKLQCMNDQLSQTDKLKSEFLAVVSHELRTPLTAIIAFTEILLSEGETLSTVQREYLTDIQESGYQLLTQINDILDMSKIEAGLIRLNCKLVDILDVIENITRPVAPLLTNKSITLSVNVHDEVPDVFIDPEKIGHVLRNLLSNAIKFTAGGGSIAITVKNGCGSEADRGIVVSVHDTGIGIDPANHDDIFQKFRQVNSSAHREYAGSGLGLAIAKNLVELHGGKIWVESCVGEGSTFYFTIPGKA